ncbi:hypothetical protein [Alteromonas sp. CYL-A6]|uniref:hypothetical protein n=1 Tax=Alteromonas nitratireducens TaxID=3390813 RepID=UPI0034B917D4
MLPGSYHEQTRSTYKKLTHPSAALVENWWAHALLSAFIGVLTLTFFPLGIAEISSSGAFGWVHYIFLPFHEAGHVFFGLLGQFMGSLGGTLGQLLMPLICVYVFLRQRNDNFGAAVCFWWFSLNFLDMAPYIADAQDGVLPLLGGNVGHSSPYGFHDWEYLLTETGLIALDNSIASGSLWCGRLMMLLACYWLAVLLKRAATAR